MGQVRDAVIELAKALEMMRNTKRKDHKALAKADIDAKHDALRELMERDDVLLDDQDREALANLKRLYRDVALHQPIIKG